MADPSSTRTQFEALYRGSIDQVYSYARARVGPREAEDLAAEVFTAALVALERGNGESVTEAWLIGVTRNKVIDRWRSAQRRMAKQHLLRPVQASERNDPYADRVILTLDRLSLKYRALLILHYLDGHPMHEVADQLGLTLEGARSSIARARRAFRVEFEGVTADG